MVLTQEERKERHRIASRKWRLNNPDKQKKSEENYRKNNKEKEHNRHINYRNNYPDKCKESSKKYRKTEKGIKSQTINRWKFKGLIDDYEMVYERYSMAIFCDECECVLDQCEKSVKSMDHCHTTGLFRNILCRSCNVKRK
jgi:hypothetical protein